MTYYFDQDPEPQPQSQPEPPLPPFDTTGYDPHAYDPAYESAEDAAEHGPRPWRLFFHQPHEEEQVERGEEIVAARDQRWTGRAIILIAVVMAVLNAASITSWASSLPPNWSTETIRAVADVWAARLADLGLDQPRAIIRKGYEAQKAKRWK